jgi:hypothetical protein
MISPCKNKSISKLEYTPQNVDTCIYDLDYLNFYNEINGLLTFWGIT